MHGIDLHLDTSRLKGRPQLSYVEIETSSSNFWKGVCEQENTHARLLGPPFISRPHSLHLATVCGEVNNDLAPKTGNARLMRPPDPPQLSAIVVAYDSGPQLHRCLTSIQAELDREDITGEIWVIDNGSRDGATSNISNESGIQILKNERNLGFGAAVNQGFRRSRGEMILLLNPDAELETGGLAPLVETLRSQPETDLAAPALILPNGERQASPRRFYTPLVALARRTPLARAPLGRRLLGVHLMSQEDPMKPQDVDWVSGAAMLLRRSSVPTAGPFDERYFLYFEDVDLCRRLAASGRKVHFEPASRVRHALAGGSRRQVPWNPLLWRHLHSGLLYGLAWSPRLWRSRWWIGAATQGLTLLARGVLLAIIAQVLLAAAVLPPMSPALLFTLCSLGALITPTGPGSILGRAPLPSPPIHMLRLSAVGISTLAVFAALSSAPVSLSTLVGTVAWAALAALLLNIAGRVLRSLRQLTRRSVTGPVRTLVAGEPEASREFCERVAEDGNERLSVLGFVPLNPLCEGGPTPRLRSFKDITDVAADLRAQAVVIVGGADELQHSAAQVHALRRAGVAVTYVMTGATELLQPDGGLRIGSYPALQLGSGAESRAMLFISSLAGRLSAGLALLTLLPAAPLLLGLSCLAGKSQPLLSCPRVGVGGRPFLMLRLRSGPGIEGREGGGRLGRALRWLHIDELPQLWNVVRGDMALVGPRPIEPALASKLDDWQAARLSVRPGITGVWQLDRLRRWRLDEMIASDLLYVLRWSLMLDLGILSETLLGRRNP